jgi:hypothetical protein
MVVLCKNTWRVGFPGLNIVSLVKGRVRAVEVRQRGMMEESTPTVTQSRVLYTNHTTNTRSRASNLKILLKDWTSVMVVEVLAGEMAPIPMVLGARRTRKIEVCWKM